MKTPKRKTRKSPRQRVDSLTSGDRFELLEATAGCDPGAYIYEGITEEAKACGKDLVEILDNGLSMVIPGDTLVRKLK
jgi:hypothetical protein